LVGWWVLCGRWWVIPPHWWVVRWVGVGAGHEVGGAIT
jgi:hypothetical protein